MRRLVKSNLYPNASRREAAPISRRLFQSGLLSAVAGCWAPAPSWAGTLSAADASRRAREDAIRALPLQRLQPAAQRRVLDITQGASIFRRMPLEVINCDPEMYVFLIRYPEVIVDMWRLMGVTQVAVQRVADYVVRADDGSGTKTDIELLYGTPAMHLVVAEGEYSGPLFRRRMQGRCALLLRSAFQADNEGRTRVSNQLEIFLQIDNLGADLAARTMQSMIGRTADQNFVESARFIEQVCMQSEVNMQGMTKLAGRLRAVDEPVRERFTTLVGRVAQQAQVRELNASRGPVGQEGARLGARPER